MPWCHDCDRFLSPASVLADGSCPRCGRAVDPGRAKAPVPLIADTTGGPPTEETASAAHQPRADQSEAGPDAEPPLDPLPWHFKLLLGAIALYLGYRAFQGIEWLAGL